MLLVLTGKSGSGKNALQNYLINSAGFERYITATTRPMREGEKNGVNYYFLNNKDFLQKLKDDGFIENREYKTLVGNKPEIWYYGSPKKELSPEKNYIIILDLEGAEKFVNYYGEKNCFVVYLNVDDEIRRIRTEKRGSFNLCEWENRLKDDEEKFSYKNLFGVVDLIVDNSFRSIEETAEVVLQRVFPKQSFSFYSIDGRVFNLKN